MRFLSHKDYILPHTLMKFHMVGAKLSSYTVVRIACKLLVQDLHSLIEKKSTSELIKAEEAACKTTGLGKMYMLCVLANFS